VLLLQAPLGREQAPALPLGLAFVAAGLGQAHQLRIMDANVHSERQLRSAVAEQSPDAVGISLRNIDTTNSSDPYCYFAHFPPFVSQVRSWVGDVPIVAGGTGFTLFPAEIMARVPELDFGVCSEGENSFGALLRSLADPGQVAGICYRQDGALRFTEPVAPTDLAQLRPRLDLLDMERYRRFDRNYGIGVQTKRGCGLACTYCTYRLLSQPLALRPTELVADELEWLVGEHGIRQIFFADSIFNLPQEHAAEICEQILRRDLRFTWRAYHHERHLSHEYVALAVRAGCGEFTFSPDGWSAPSLALLGKDIDKGDVLRCLEIVRDVPGAHAHYNFFLGLPGQRLSELAGILGFYARARRALGPRLLGVRLGHVRVEPRTVLQRRLVEQGFFPADLPLLPENDTDVARLFQTRTGSRRMDLFCRLARPERWPLAPRHSEPGRGKDRS